MKGHRYLLVISVSIVYCLGLVMIFNTTSAEIMDQDLDKNPYLYLLKQCIYGLIALVLGAGLTRFGIRQFVKASPLLLFLFSFLLVLCLVPGIGKEVNGSKRWIALGGVSFQPSEFVKYIVPFFFVTKILSLERKREEYLPFVKALFLVLPPLALILLEPNNGTVGVILTTLIALFYLLKIPLKFWALPLAVILTVGALSAVSLPYVRGRLKVYMNPEYDIRGKGHQPYQAKIAAGSGGLFGKGPGNSWQKLSYLPEAQNDYIAAIFAEEFGFIGMGILILLYMIITYAGVAIAYRCPDTLGFYIASTVTFIISFQAFMNLGVVSGLLPSTGLNLPFFSQGGSSLIANLIGTGILLELSNTDNANCHR